MPNPSQSWTVPRQPQPQTLLEAVRGKLKLSNRQAKARIDARDVFVNGKRVWMARHLLRPGDKVEVILREAVEEEPLKLLYQDEWLLAVNKPSGLVSDGDSDSVESRLRKQEHLPDARALHRLDRDTSGVLLLNRRARDREPYVDLFRGHQLRKQYLALVRGAPESARFEINSRLDGKEALTRVQVLSRNRAYSLLACEIPTGRTHQIRRHLGQRNLVIAGDRTYGVHEAPPAVERGVPRQLLHAWNLEVPCPHSGKTLRIQAPPPPDFADWMKRLGLRMP